MNRRQIIQATVGYVEEHLALPLCIEEIAASIYYSKHHLLHEFSSYTKFSLYDYIKKRRLHEAGMSLLETPASIIDVALASGYQTQQSFSKAFSQIYKLSPKEFRKNNRVFGILESMNNNDFPRNHELSKVMVQVAAKGDRMGILNHMKSCQWAFPYWESSVFDQQIYSRIKNQEVVIAKIAEQIVGVLVFDSKNRHIDGLSSLPLVWEYGVERSMLQYLFRKRASLPNGVTTTSFRAEDKLDIGYHARLLSLGFRPMELLEEYNYPTQRFVLTNDLRQVNCKTGSV